jgi:2-dehydropantoate 2-reductase
LAYVEELRAKAASHIGSTTVDLQGGRATEIDVMNGAVVRLGKRLGVPTPANATLADFIRLIEATRPVRLPVPI